jgi:ribose transport system ATP-binding protein
MPNPVVVRMSGIVKRFPGVLALDHVDFDLERGEVHCLVGENGAGKSTLMKVLAGVYKCEEGEIYLENQRVQIEDPSHSRALGINVVYQELELIPSLSVAENIFLGNEAVKGRIIDWKRTEQSAEELLLSLGIEISARRKVEGLSIAQQQLITIAKAVSRESKVIIMDEPSAVLSGKSLDLLFRTIKQLREKDISVVFISHHLAEVYEVGDRVTVMRDSKIVQTSRVQDISLGEMISGMIGRKLQEHYYKKQTQIGKTVLAVRKLNQGKRLKDVSFELQEREILGIFGLIGAGRTELSRAIIGADPIDGGEIVVNGQSVSIKDPGKALALKIGYLSESRRESGLLMLRTLGENITLPVLKRFRKGLFGLDFKKMIAQALEQIGLLKIKPPTLGCDIANLSGGNQQKVVFAKWLGAGCDILILDEPTRGIDVGTKEEIYHLMADIVAQGRSIILISSELPEVMALSDRILIMNEGTIVKEADPAAITQEEILTLAIPRSLSRSKAAV